MNRGIEIETEDSNEVQFGWERKPRSLIVSESDRRQERRRSCPLMPPYAMTATDSNEVQFGCLRRSRGGLVSKSDRRQDARGAERKHRTTWRHDTERVFESQGFPLYLSYTICRRAGELSGKRNALSPGRMR